MDSSSETDAVGPTASPPAAAGPPLQSSSTTPENPLPPSISSQNPQPPLNHSHLQQHHLLQTQQPNFQQRPPLNLSRAQQTSFQSGGVALGVPARQQQMPPSSFSAFGGPFNQPFGGMPRNSVNMQETNSQVRQTSKGIQSIGMIGSLGSSSQMRPSGPPGHNLQRPGQPPMRTQSPSNNQSLATQKFQSPGMMRVPSIASTSSPSTGTVQASQSHPQPWMSTQGKQMHSSALSSSSYRPQMKLPSMQRPHLPQQYTHSMPTSHQQHIPPTHQQQQQQPSQSHQSQEHQGQQYPSARIPQTAPHLQQVIRGPGSANQKSLAGAAVQPNVLQSAPLTSLGSNEIPDGGTHILSKRSIQELVTQIDPSERLDPEVEDVLVDIAEDFVESITTFACSLAKHRKSTTLEAKDILLHLERNWNMTLPGFGGDELKAYKKPLTNDAHRERLAAIKKSVLGTEAGMPKNSTGQAAANMKGHTAKAPVGSEKI